MGYYPKYHPLLWIKADSKESATAIAEMMPEGKPRRYQGSWYITFPKNRCSIPKLCGGISCIDEQALSLACRLSGQFWPHATTHNVYCPTALLIGRSHEEASDQGFLPLGHF